MVEKDEYRKQTNFYNLGIYNNIKSVMGPIYLWLIPIAYNNIYKGYSFDINSSIYEDYLYNQKLEKDAKKLNSTISILLNNNNNNNN